MLSDGHLERWENVTIHDHQGCIDKAFSDHVLAYKPDRDVPAKTPRWQITSVCVLKPHCPQFELNLDLIYKLSHHHMGGGTGGPFICHFLMDLQKDIRHQTIVYTGCMKCCFHENPSKGFMWELMPGFLLGVFGPPQPLVHCLPPLQIVLT